MRLEGHESVPSPGGRGLLGGRLRGGVAAFTLVDHYDAKTDMSARLGTPALPASIVIQMWASGAIRKRGGVFEERDVPADLLLEEMAKLGIQAEYPMEQKQDQRRRTGVSAPLYLSKTPALFLQRTERPRTEYRSRAMMEAVG
jgi:hypothetical protein